MNKERRDAEIAQVADEWDADEMTGVYQGLPSEPTRKQPFPEIQAELAKAFGSNESRTIELEPEIWMDCDLSELDDNEQTEI